jgi:hypothetical protein
MSIGLPHWRHVHHSSSLYYHSSSLHHGISNLHHVHFFQMMQLSMHVKIMMRQLPEMHVYDAVFAETW